MKLYLMLLVAVLSGCSPVEMKTAKDFNGQEKSVVTLLFCEVSAEGICENVTVKKTSGNQEIDKAAQEAVKQWKFVPVRKGNTNVPATVTVPIKFKLSE